MSFHVGVHLAGTQSRDSSVTLLRLSEGSDSLVPIFEGVYTGLGPLAGRSSTERILTILEPFSELSIVTGAPLTLPPCGRCALTSCPGESSCADVGVAALQKFSRSKNHRKKRKKKSFCPQQYRVFDPMANQLKGYELFDIEATSGNARMHLFLRAKTLQKRLAFSKACFSETSLPHVLSYFGRMVGRRFEDYRSFDKGRDCLLELLEFFRAENWIEWKEGGIFSKDLLTLPGVFSLLCAYTSVLIKQGKVYEPPSDFHKEQGWVYLPNL